MCGCGVAARLGLAAPEHDGALQTRLPPSPLRPPRPPPLPTETKRSEFPRFYFVSDPTLLECLSMGSDPPSVVPHFQSGLFDSLSNVTFDKVRAVCVLRLHSVMPQHPSLLSMCLSNLFFGPRPASLPHFATGRPHQDAGDVQPGGRVRAL